MNKIFKVATLLVILATVSSFSEEKDVKFSVRAGFSLYDYPSGERGTDKYISRSRGFNGGFVISRQIANSISLVQEIGFLYRKLLFMDLKDIEVWVNEFAISLPLMLQFRPVEGTPFYWAAGIQIDPLTASEMRTKTDYEEKTENIRHRRIPIDFGIPLGFGYLITPNFGIDLRTVIDVTSPYKNDKDAGWSQYGFGLNYYF